ncbi:MAG: hypothetical protein EBT93_06980 [Alphaproteobacteria bacterium]|jgi:hypothetical protein|nr:hypothetical protein [Alphaproteobacteria bacterium]
MPRYRHHSLGELISTICFFGVAVYLTLSGFDWKDQGDLFRAWISWFAALLCYLGAIRFRLAQLAMNIQQRQRRKNAAK